MLIIEIVHVINLRKDHPLLEKIYYEMKQLRLHRTKDVRLQYI